MKNLLPLVTNPKFGRTGNKKKPQPNVGAINQLLKQIKIKHHNTNQIRMDVAVMPLV